MFFLNQKLANLNAALGFGRNDQHGAAMSKSRKDTSVCRNVHISISASWFVGELECRRVGLSASCPVTVQTTEWLISNCKHAKQTDRTTTAVKAAETFCHFVLVANAYIALVNADGCAHPSE